MKIYQYCFKLSIMAFVFCFICFSKVYGQDFDENLLLDGADKAETIMKNFGTKILSFMMIICGVGGTLGIAWSFMTWGTQGQSSKKIGLAALGCLLALFLCGYVKGKL